MLLYILVPVAFFVILDLVPAIKAKRFVYVCIYSAMSTTVLACWALLGGTVELPGPNNLIKAVVEFFTGPLD